MRLFKLLLLMAITAGFFYFLNFSQQIGATRLPPMGKFLSPFAGFWQNGTQVDQLPTALELPELREPVDVVWDDRHVPHVFAKNAHDLYFAQGYLTARDRLWQMEFQTHYAAGRLSEIVGERALPLDRFQRRIGMVYAAENALKGMQEDPEGREALEAYAAGVNAYIAELDEISKPLEYKILDYSPEKWQPIKSALLLKYMAWDLTGRNNERAMTRTLAALGPELTDKLNPYYPPMQDPIIPSGTKWDFEPERAVMPANTTPPLDDVAVEQHQPDPFIGSNNWAVAGTKTAQGHAILANDPHLRLRLPSIWYEMQLSMPNLNVYGVTLPGTPCIIVGFNESIAWGVTNAGSDVLDWYRIRFKDASQREYWHDEQWKPTIARIEEIKIRGAQAVIDTVFYTHHGPVVETGSSTNAESATVPGAAMRWIAHDSSQELNAFMLLNRARNYDDYLQALRAFDSPAQNIAFADIAGDIAIWHNGKFPLRWKGQGRFISDGTDPLHDWQGWVPREDVPHIKNPQRGFVSSANQHPTDESYPYYLGWDYASFTRGARINERLMELRAITPQDMIDLQNDALNLTARNLLPAMLAAVESQNLTEGEQKVLNVVKAWDYRNNAIQAAPLIFDQWRRILYDLMWSDEVIRADGNLQWPRSDVTIATIIEQPKNNFFDLKATANKTESFEDIAFQAFRQAKDELEAELGPIGKPWAWGKASGTDILHLAQIPGFGRTNLFTSGGSGIVNATRKYNGPSWRMVVELAPAGVQAWGIYPGGQSGHAGSYFYDNMVDDWVDGRPYALLFMRSVNEKNEKIVAKTQMRGQP